MIKYRNIFAVIVFSIITCGIYNLFWQYNISKELQEAMPECDLAPGLDLLLSILCLPYMFYWIYKVSKTAANVEFSLGMRGTDNAIINLLLAIFGFGLISMIIIQSQLNDIAARQNI